jgi:hypothetical protein
MKATLQFDLPEESHEFRCATAGVELASALIDIDQILRSVTKHGRDPVESVQTCRSLIAQALQKVE